MRFVQCGALFIGTAIGLGGGLTSLSHAIEIRPSPVQVQAAVDRGKEAAAQHQSPDMFYTRFGTADEVQPSGWLLTKLGAVSVMATHMALRGLEPSAADLAQVTEALTMQVSTVIFGDSPTFAIDSYMVLDQKGTVAKPITIRADGRATRSATWPGSPRFKAHVVAAFAYGDFDPNARTTITVFPASGGEVGFPVDFAQIQ